jgi:hypothetical protein
MRHRVATQEVVMASYLHQVPGRIRLRSARFREDAGRRAAAVEALSGLRGVRSVDARGTSGSITVHFDEVRICPSEIIATLTRYGDIDGLVGFPQLAVAAGAEGASFAPQRALAPVIYLAPRQAPPSALGILPVVKTAVIVAAQIAAPLLLERLFGRTGKLAAKVLF